MPVREISNLCADCQSFESILEIRKRRLCADCFLKYVHSKVLKRMESYRFKNLAGDQKKRLFLPLSGGVSSMALLHILDAQLQRQITNRNRTAYELVVSHVIPPNQGQNDISPMWYQKVAERFASHTFLPSVAVHEVLTYDLKLEEDMKQFDVHRKPGEDNLDFYKAILSSTKSVTTRTDIHELFLRRLLVAMAKQNDCESILWGHSDSRLAAQALSDVAKGRGGSIPSTIADGPSAFGINFNYPLRDLFRTELQLYAETLSDSLLPLLDPDSGTEESVTSVRHTSIDNLLSNYIDSQGEKYPSIMANVVRTASKLQPPRLGSDTISCAVCYSPMEPTNTNEDKICYGCKRMKQDIRMINANP